jgi:hypothetical protein
MKTCLVVANQTLPGEPLAALVRQRIAEGECTFHVVVPLTPVPHGAVWEERESAEAARGRLAQFLGVVRAQGCTADGEIGDRDPIQAVRDVLRNRVVDEIILSTLPPGPSRWLRQDLPHRLARVTRTPVVHVAAPAEHPAGTRS